jgi:hypothetical protein
MDLGVSLDGHLNVLPKSARHSLGWHSLRFPCRAPGESHKASGKSFPQKRLTENSLESLRLSLRIGLNLQILGRICKIQGFERKNSLLNSLPQGIVLMTFGHKKARWVCGGRGREADLRDPSKT